MTDRNPKKDHHPTAEVSVNWEGIARFLGWNGSISDLKRIELDTPGDSLAHAGSGKR